MWAWIKLDGPKDWVKAENYQLSSGFVNLKIRSTSGRNLGLCRKNTARLAMWICNNDDQPSDFSRYIYIYTYVYSMCIYICIYNVYNIYIYMWLYVCIFRQPDATWSMALKIWCPKIWCWKNHPFSFSEKPPWWTRLMSSIVFNGRSVISRVLFFFDPKKTFWVY